MKRNTKELGRPNSFFVYGEVSELTTRLTDDELGVRSAWRAGETGKNQSQAIDRKHEAVVSRVLLDEDPDTFFKDDDEIRCRIQVSSPDLSTNLTQAFTDQFIVDIPVSG